MSWFRRTPKDPNRCHIDEEWCGYFIGRRWCSTHQVKWDDGGRCPHEGEPPYQSRQGRVAQDVPKLKVGTLVPLITQVRRGGLTHDYVENFVITQATYGEGAIHIELQDLESHERQNRYEGNRG